MASKQVALIPTEEITSFNFTPAEIDAYNFAVRNAGVEMDEEAEADFITSRNAKSGWLGLWEKKAVLKKFVDSIEEVVKHAWNMGTEEQIPHDDGIKISWSKQSYTYEWCSEDAPRFVAQKLIESNLVTSEQLFDQLNPNQVIKASGITMEKLMSLFDGAVNEKPKARTLSIKK
jgi:hypothetical protein